MSDNSATNAPFQPHYWQTYFATANPALAGSLLLALSNQAEDTKASECYRIFPQKCTLTLGHSSKDGMVA